MNSLTNVSNPLTPQQSIDQVVTAARELVGLLGLHVVEAFAWHSSCRDEGNPPFMGAGRIGYAKAPTYEQSDAEIADMVKILRRNGWGDDPSFHSHGTVLMKNNVVVDFAPQTDATLDRNIEITGECRDVTTTKESSGKSYPITFGP